MGDVSKVSESRRLIVSPIIMHGEMTDGARPKSRAQMLDRVREMLGFTLNTSALEHVMQVRTLAPDIAKDENLWGGDGIVLTIPAKFTARQFYKALTRNDPNPLFVVFEPATGQHIGKPDWKVPVRPTGQPAANVLKFPGLLNASLAVGLQAATLPAWIWA